MTPFPPRGRPALPRAATPMAFARVIAAAYERRGMSAAQALKRAQIAPQKLLQPEARITAIQMEELSGTAMRELDDEGLGAFTRALPWGTYGMLARASLTSPDLGLALRRWCRHHGLVAPGLDLQVVTSGARSAITAEAGPAMAQLGPAALEFCLVHVLRNVHGLACWYIDSRIPLQAASFPYPAPAHADAYRHMFPAPVVFGAARASIEFDTRYLTLALVRDEKAMRQMLQRALPLTVLQYRRDRLLVQQVRQVIQVGGGHDAESVASALNMSARTLHRQLRSEGSSLQEIKAAAQFERARDLLARTSRPVKQVAGAVGFRNDKSFSRAFRAWAGMGPAEFRNRAREEATAG